MEANRVTWIKNLVGNILLMFLVLDLIPVLFCFMLFCFLNFVNTPIIPQREPSTKYLFFFFSQSINVGRWEFSTKQCFLPDCHRSTVRSPPHLWVY